MERSKVIALLLVAMHWTCRIESSRVGRHTTIERHSDVDHDLQVFNYGLNKIDFFNRMQLI
jgi:hypothetical protein